MPRGARLVVPGVPLHIVQRGNNRGGCFFADADRRFYLSQLSEHLERFGCALHAYCLMSNHVHLLLTPSEPGSAASLMKKVGQRHTQYINRMYRRTGTLWEGRFRSCLVESAAYLLACYRYIESNPVRPAGRPCGRPHPGYLALGDTLAERAAIYRAQFDYGDPASANAAIREATKGGHALGSPGFKRELSRRIGRRVEAGEPGRPRATRPQPPAQHTLFDVSG